MLVSAVHQHEAAIGIHVSPRSWTSLPPPSHPTSLGGHSSPGWAPCIKQQIPTGCPFHTWWCMFPSHYQFVPPSPSPYVSLSLCLRLLANGFISTIFLDSICMCVCVNIRYLFFSFWFTSLCMIGSRFIHLIRTDLDVFFIPEERK